MSQGLFYWCIYYVSGPENISVVFLSMEGQIALRFHQKHLNLCSEDEWRSYRFGTTWGWVMYRILILGWTPLTPSTIQSIPDGQNQVPLFCLIRHFTQIYLTIGKKIQSQFQFHHTIKYSIHKLYLPWLCFSHWFSWFHFFVYSKSSQLIN